MILSFTVTYDTEIEQYQIKDPENCDIEHSGSSYLRITTPDLYGTIGTHNPYEGSTHKYLTVDIW